MPHKNISVKPAAILECASDSRCGVSAGVQATQGSKERSELSNLAAAAELLERPLALHPPSHFVQVAAGVGGAHAVQGAAGGVYPLPVLKLLVRSTTVRAHLHLLPLFPA
eukprot:1154540-Pelagomonas_calceolata.AAC.1